jgi:hypothetical protein
VVQKSVEDGGGDDLAPFGKALVAGDDHGAAFVSSGDELEDHVGFGPVQGQVADFVHDQDRGTQVGLELPVEPAGGQRSQPIQRPPSAAPNGS